MTSETKKPAPGGWLWPSNCFCRGGHADAVRQLSVVRHQQRKRQLDELFVLVGCIKSAAHVGRDFSGTALLDPVGQLEDGGLKGRLVSVDFEERGRVQI